MGMMHLDHSIDLWFAQALRDLLTYGKYKSDRTGTGTFSVHGYTACFNVGRKLPLLRLKKTNWLAACREMDFFLDGDCFNISSLQAEGIHIWDEWADAQGNVGPIYGSQWRHWPTPQGGQVDQLSDVLNSLLRDPMSRRMIVEAWNPALLPRPGLKPHEQAAHGRMALPPCHKSWQVLVNRDEDDVYVLDLKLEQRSADCMIGVPFNVVQYAYLMHRLVAFAHRADRPFRVGELKVNYGDFHLYANHVEQAKEVIRRLESGELPGREPPQMVITRPQAANHTWQMNARAHVKVLNYEKGDYLPFIHLPVAV